MLQSLNIIKERLKANNYDRIQHLPSRRSIAVGKEFYVFKSFFFQRTPCLFHSTCFYTLYHLIFRRRYPRLYLLYKIFFMNEPTDKATLLNLFSAGEVDDFIKAGIIKYEGCGCRFNFRFVPYEGLFLVAKINMEDPEYAHLNYDSITFVEFLRKMRLKESFVRALEIGCGAGLISIEVAKSANNVDAVDINPYAVKIADINTKLNNIPNITTFISDIYNGVKERYDLIISDPPFELMPDEEKSILHRYGGFLGMEIASRIFAGLDEYLEDDGEAIVFTNSYVKGFKIDTLKDALFEMFENKKFKLTLYTLSYQINPEFYPIYRKFNITHSIGYIVRIKRSDNFEMNVVPLNFFKRIKEVLRLCYLYVIIFLSRHR